MFAIRSSRLMALAGVVAASAPGASSAPVVLAAPPSLTAVVIRGSAYQPSVARAPIHGTVVWTNADGIAHTVSECDATDCPVPACSAGACADRFVSPTITYGSYMNTFDSDGTYNYFCRVHGFAVMHGQVVVSASARSTPGQLGVSSRLEAAVGVGGGAGLASRVRIAGGRSGRSRSQWFRPL